MKRNALGQNRTQRTPSLILSLIPLRRRTGRVRSFRGADAIVAMPTRATSPQSHRLTVSPSFILPAALESFYLSESSSPYLEIAPAFCRDGGGGRIDERNCACMCVRAAVRPSSGLRLPACPRPSQKEGRKEGSSCTRSDSTWEKKLLVDDGIHQGSMRRKVPRARTSESMMSLTLPESTFEVSPRPAPAGV